MKKVIISTVCVCSMILLLNSCQPEENLSPANENSASSGSGVLVKVNVTIEIGDIVYENLDALIRVKGFDATNTMKWMKDYNFVGPSESLEVKNGFHHYSIELVDKWGINDIQSEIPGTDIWLGRVDGPTPITYNLGGSKEAKKLSSYVTSREVNLSGERVYQPESRVSYEYDNEGHLEYIHYETYNPDNLQFEETMTDYFTYNASEVESIVRRLNGKLYSESDYEYGVESKVVETNYFTGIVTNQITSKHVEIDPTDLSVSVNWSFSNGSSFLYEFDDRFKNMVSDMTVKNNEICNKGNYTYDKFINPFRHLGFIDLNLQNWSVNNKLSEDVDFLACSYPTIIPLFYLYTYDQDGYPVEKITKYKSKPNQNMAYHSKVEFYYE